MVEDKEVDEIIMALLGTNTLYRLLRESVRTNIELREMLQKYRINKPEVKMDKTELNRAYGILSK